MTADNPLLPLVGITAVLLGLLGILVFAFMKLRGPGRGKPAAGADRLSEEAFAAATIKAALAARPRAAGAPAVAVDRAAVPTASTARSWTVCRPASS